MSIAVLARIPLFADLEPSELELLSHSMSERRFDAGEVVTTEGKAGEGFFVIESGEAEVTALGQPVARITAGDYFGEIALLMGSQRTATITALSALRCYWLSPVQFRAMVEGNPTIAWKVMQAMVARLG